MEKSVTKMGDFAENLFLAGSKCRVVLILTQFIYSTGKTSIVVQNALDGGLQIRESEHVTLHRNQPRLMKFLICVECTWRA